MKKNKYFFIKQVLKNGIPKFQSPPDMSLITCLSMTNDCNVVAYGCYNGSVRLYYLDVSAVKTLGSHQEQVTDLAVSMDTMPENDMEMVVVVSGSRDGSIMIWWDGGPAFKLLHKLKKKHHTSIQEVDNSLKKNLI